jgi:peptide/nickel transport system permease protein
MLRDWPGRVGSLIVAAVVLGAICAPLLSPYDPGLMSISDAFQPPSLQHWLGTDQLGRDVLTRMLYGGRLSLLVGVGTVLLGIGLGLPLGMVAGAFGGKLDDLIMRVVDVLLSLPALILAMAVIAILGPGVLNIIVAIGVRAVPIYARIARAEVMVVTRRDFVQAAEALGASRARILARHVFPNIVAPVIAISGLRVATAILTAASLTFLGLGLPPGEPEWGVMVNEAKQYIRTYPHLITYPGCMIMIAILGFNLVGDTVHDLLNPRLRHRIDSRKLV